MHLRNLGHWRCFVLQSGVFVLFVVCLEVQWTWDSLLLVHSNLVSWASGSASAFYRRDSCRIHWCHLPRKVLAISGRTLSYWSLLLQLLSCDRFILFQYVLFQYSLGLHLLRQLQHWHWLLGSLLGGSWSFLLRRNHETSLRRGLFWRRWHGQFGRVNCISLRLLSPVCGLSWLHRFALGERRTGNSTLARHLKHSKCMLLSDYNTRFILVQSSWRVRHCSCIRS